MFGFGKNKSSEQTTGIKLVLLLGNSSRHYYFADQLSKHFNILGIVSEASKAHMLSELSDAHPLVRLHFTDTFEKEGLYFGKYHNFKMPKERMLIMPYGQASAAVPNFVSKLNPDYIISFDSSPISNALLAAYPGKVLHLHNGLINYYNGNGANLWPIIDQHPECVGMTVHLIEDSTDSGHVLGQIRPELAISDTMGDFELKSVIAGTNLTNRAIIEYQKGTITPQDMERSRINHTLQDLSADKILQTKQVLTQQGLIQNFLSQKKQLLQSNPIFEIP